jgi:hypothetical protein
VSSRRLIPLLLVVGLALAGCGATKPSTADGTARLWVTRDRGQEVLVETTVPAGQTLLRALRSKASVTTRYGGGFVQSIEGVEGSAGQQADWFWFVNGLAGDRSAASYRLRDGDVAWWDYRDWSGDAQTLEVVAGAFPEPFLHGYDGATRPGAVRYGPGLRDGALRIARVLGTEDVAPLSTRAPTRSNVFELTAGRTHLRAALRTPGAGPAGAVRFSYAGPVDALLSGRYRRRFSVP